MEGRELSTYNQRQVDKGMPVSGCASPQGTTQILQFGRPHHGRERLLQGQTDGNGTDTPSGRGPITSHQPAGSTTLVLYRWPHDILTRMISLTATTPEVAIILALFGIKLKIVGIMASAPWSNLFPRTDDRCLQQERTSCSHILTHREAQRLSTVDSPPSQFS